MKITKKISWMMATLMVVALSFMSCTKEGPAGLPGKDGKDGEDGINGQDGTAGCIVCHSNDQSLFARTIQWEVSTHATGGNFERNSASCAACHTSQGFIEQLETGAVAATVSNPNPPNCYTCHDIHSSYTADDWALKTVAPVETNPTGDIVDFGKGNLCANCHQSRSINPMPVLNGDDVTFTSYRYGGHHGPQANVVAGVGFLAYPGGGLGNNLHSSMIEDGCVTCHMAEPFGLQTGGHTMKIRGSSLNTTSCLACHTDQAELLAATAALQTEVDGLLEELKVALIAAGIYDDGTHGHEGYAVPGTHPANVAGAWLTYQMILEDRSKGVHNPTFVVGQLTNAIAALD